MAARTRKAKHDDFTRERIRTTQLVNRLEKHALGEIAMEPTQVRAIEVLLRKSLPDLSNVQLSGDKDNPVGVVFQTVYERSNN
jgi:hypothetical protein